MSQKANVVNQFDRKIKKRRGDEHIFIFHSHCLQTFSLKIAEKTNEIENETDIHNFLFDIFSWTSEVPLLDLPGLARRKRQRILPR
jgi:hypothetical protein